MRHSLFVYLCVHFGNFSLMFYLQCLALQLGIFANWSRKRTVGSVCAYGNPRWVCVEALWVPRKRVVHTGPWNVVKLGRLHSQSHWSCRRAAGARLGHWQSCVSLMIVHISSPIDCEAFVDCCLCRSSTRTCTSRHQPATRTSRS